MALQLASPLGATEVFEVTVDAGHAGHGSRRLQITGPEDAVLDWTLPEASQPAWLDLFAAASAHLGTRLPVAREPHPAAGPEPPLKPVLTAPVSPRIRYGYGDPCVVRVAEDPPSWRLLVTSNDAPDAFPILASDDLESWRLSGFVFPDGSTPGWALAGAGLADFWAPEIHRVGDEWWVCFCARATGGELAVAIARAPSPDGPFAAPEPLIRGGVIDPHIVLDDDGAPILIWKDDDNGVWPRLLASVLSARRTHRPAVRD